MTEVEILYAGQLNGEWRFDLSRGLGNRQRAPMNAAALAMLPSAGVLVIVISDNFGERTGLLARLWSRQNRFDATLPWHGEDSYAIGFTADGLRFFTDAWDDLDDHLHARSLADPHAQSTMNLTRPGRFPADARTVIFRGAWVPVPEWEAAVNLMDAEMF